ncbi:sensor histidine kinase [Beduini massiliensis]|uniref:sensor histidine kinase n=1 Tax=Beduini massiliensis TaxID=1585974 RepID=UPI00059AB04A|nr:HAMP domain-containing sensor histidine kinase [Beduini massiliensis]
MKLKFILFLFIGLLLIEGIVGWKVIEKIKDTSLDNVMVNDLSQQIGQQWETLMQTQLCTVSSNIDLDFTLLDNNGKKIYTTSPSVSQSIEAAIQNRDSIIDIELNDQRVGKILIYNDSNSRIASHLVFLMQILGGTLIIEGIILGGYTYYLNKRMIQPFRSLQRFATRVAGGDLDFPLEMDRHNNFGVFTESFDLMRTELKKARLNEQKANQSKKELVAKMSHDIKTPIASIKAILELMLIKVKDPKERGQLLIIDQKANQIDELVSDLFHATLEELQELTIFVKEHSSQELATLLQSADYQNKAVIDPVPDCLLLFDALRLQQVFDNLFGNAYKYANTSMEVHFEIVEEEFLIFIKDFGEGVTAEEQSLIFNKYYRAKNAEEKSGAGLGLYICRYIMMQMNGTIECEKTEDGFMMQLALKLA